MELNSHGQLIRSGYRQFNVVALAKGVCDISTHVETATAWTSCEDWGRLYGATSVHPLVLVGEHEPTATDQSRRALV